ncbi:MAG TPA: hypothetical protein EYP77_08395 [Anaerolineae bacterium]|nr:hypothetical protein [Anaerolineae bacterium]
MQLRQGLMWAWKPGEGPEGARRLRAAICLAVSRYVEKFGRPPTMCVLNRQDLDRLDGHAAGEVEGVRVAAGRSIAPGTFLLGSPEEST